MVPDDLDISTPHASHTSGGYANDDHVAPSHASLDLTRSTSPHHTSNSSPSASSPTLPIRVLNVIGSPPVVSSVVRVAQEVIPATNFEHDSGEVARPSVEKGLNNELVNTAIIGSATSTSSASLKITSTRKKQSFDLSLLVGTPITYKGKEGKVVDSSSAATNLYDVEIAGKLIRGVSLSDFEVSKRMGRRGGKKQ